MEEEFRRVFGEGTKEVVEREVGEEAVRAKARKKEPVPSQREGRSTIWTMECSGVGAPIM